MATAYYHTMHTLVLGALVAKLQGRVVQLERAPAHERVQRRGRKLGHVERRRYEVRGECRDLSKVTSTRCTVQTTRPTTTTTTIAAATHRAEP